MFEYGQWTDPITVEEAYPGIERRVLVHNNAIMTVHYTVSKGAEFPVHSHDTTQQSVYVIEGEVELIGEHQKTLEKGDTFVVGPDIEHGIKGIAPRSELIDSFAPPIEAYKNE